MNNQQYKNDISPKKCWELMKNEGAILVDVRTKPEWMFVGVPKVEEGMKKPIFLEWQSFPEMNTDPKYTTNLKQQINKIGGEMETSICFLCRSGARSKSAAQAMTNEGYKKCFNVIGGFEGQLNNQKHRGNQDGWKFDGLPWEQQ